MKLVKSLLLGSAAGLSVVAGAQAADLPVRKAAPVEYVRVCSAFGNGFFFIPGTETCLRISGRVRAEYRYLEPEVRSDDAIGWRARGRLNFDARTSTAYGTLRTFIRYELTRNSGNYGAAGQVASGTFGGATLQGVSGFNIPGASGNQLSVDLNKAFIQFAGITAGRATSFFDFYANDLNWGGLPTGSDTYGNDPVVLAYTASFGSGFSATLSLEDPASRRVVNTIAGLPVGFITFPGDLVGSPNIFAGQRMPEVVGALRVDQAWGSAQLSGAVHQLNSVNRELGVGGVIGGPLAGTVLGSGPYVDTEYGFAISGGVKINLPMIAPGDVLWLQGTYSQGAVNYLGVGSSLSQGRGVGNNFSSATADAFVDRFGNLKETEGYNFVAAFLHYWTPQIRQSVFGSYGRLDYSASVETPVAVSGAFIGLRPFNSVVDTDFWQVGTNLIWSPVRDLDIGVEVVYRNVDPRGRVIAGTFPITGLGTPASPFLFKTKGEDDAFEARFRIQRDF